MNATAHRLTAGTAIALYSADEEAKTGQQTLTPVLGGLAGSIFTCLPDVLEPATSPDHRDFFHSIVFAGILIGGLVKLSRWQPESDVDRFWRGVGMIAVASYLIHLTLDATTAKSLPLLGRI
jgi:inner membrane protein